MNTATVNLTPARAQHVTVTEDTLTVDLLDGRTISVPLAWYPRLLYATMAERQNWRLIGDGIGMHWPDLDEDIRVANLLAGNPSDESQHSLAHWMEQQEAARAPDGT
jgi:hypothetical protein